MADIAVSSLVHKLDDLMQQNPSYFYGVIDQVQSLRQKLSEMQPFLKDLDAKGKEDDRLKDLAVDIRDVTYGAEDVIDNFLLKVFQRRRQQRPGFIGSIKRCAFILKELIARRKVVEEIGGMNIRLDLFYSAIQYFGVISNVTDHEEVLSLPSGLSADELKQILIRSYDKLPYFLKSCLFYFRVVVEGLGDISVKRLIKMWTAEDFLPVENGKLKEEIGKDCLQSLVRRHLVRITEWECDGSPRRCQMQHVLYHICASEAEDEGFLLWANRWKSGRKIRRFVEQSNFFLYLPNAPNLRAYYLADPQDIFLLGDFFDGIGRFKLLKMIDLINVPISKLDGMKSLFHLRYLGLRGTMLETIPSWICNLCNLQTLDVRNTEISMIANELWNITTLRHVYLTDWQFGGDEPHGHCPPSTMSVVPENLQTLRGVCAGGWIANVMPKFTNLRKLALYGVLRDSDGMSVNSALSISLGKLSNLSSLLIQGRDAIPADSIIKAFSSQNSLLKKLVLNGPFINKQQLPRSHEFPPKLMQLDLSFSLLEQDPMPTLEKLPHLKRLKLCHSYQGKHMTCSAGGFPQLISLEISGFYKLEGWNIEKEAMPSLKHLLLRYCTMLKMIPDGLRNIIVQLDELSLINMTKEFERKIEAYKREDWYKRLQHVPGITIAPLLDHNIRRLYM